MDIDNMMEDIEKEHTKRHDEHLKNMIKLIEKEAYEQGDHETSSALRELLTGVNMGEVDKYFENFIAKGYELDIQQNKPKYKQEGETFTISTPMPTIVLKKVLYRK